MKKDLELAENNFKALNDQLMEELPKFRQLAQSIFDRCEGALLSARWQLASSSLAVLEEAVDAEAHGGIDVFGMSLTRDIKTVVGELLKLHMMPQSLGRDFDVPLPVRVKRPPPQITRSNSRDSIKVRTPRGSVESAGLLSPASATSSPSSRFARSTSAPSSASGRTSTSSLSSSGSSARRRSTRGRKEAEPEYAISKYEFEATNDTELELDVGVRVLVVQKHDVSGNDEWWLCERPDGERGFVPAAYLGPDEEPAAEENISEADESVVDAIGSCLVLYSFDASSEAELTVEDGEVLSVLATHDPQNNDEWWLVGMKGGEIYAFGRAN